MGTLTGVVTFFTKTAIGRILGGLMIAFAAIWAWTAHIERGASEKATGKVIGQVTEATNTESDRRLKGLEEVQNNTAATLNRIEKNQARTVGKLEELDNASRANDSRPCLSADSVQRLSEIGASH